mmetsp:Transcript_36383/g.71924  ORF Transcript_36383/g.71924 Transcript_36383/m.71924 type:complete len:267 (-) Transcript_36383:290-1090(-)
MCSRNSRPSDAQVESAREPCSSTCLRSSAIWEPMHCVSCDKCSWNSTVRFFKVMRRSSRSDASCFSNAPSRATCDPCFSLISSRAAFNAAFSWHSLGSSVRNSMIASSTRPVKLESACCCNCTSSRTTFCPSRRSRISRTIISRACSISDFTKSRRSLPKPRSSSRRASASDAIFLSSASTLASRDCRLEPQQALSLSKLAFRVMFSSDSLGSASKASATPSLTCKRSPFVSGRVVALSASSSLAGQPLTGVEVDKTIPCSCRVGD